VFEFQGEELVGQLAGWTARYVILKIPEDLQQEFELLNFVFVEAEKVKWLGT